MNAPDKQMLLLSAAFAFVSGFCSIVAVVLLLKGDGDRGLMILLAAHVSFGASMLTRRLETSDDREEA